MDGDSRHARRATSGNSLASVPGGVAVVWLIAASMAYDPCSDSTYRRPLFRLEAWRGNGPRGLRA